MSYSYSKNLDKSFDKAEESVRDVLSEIGFGVLTEINVNDAFKEKLGITFKKYKILGACNPQLAHEAINHDDNVGILMPCNVVLSEVDENITEVKFPSAEAILSVTHNSILSDLALNVDNLMKNAFDRLD